MTSGTAVGFQDLDAASSLWDILTLMDTSHIPRQGLGAGTCLAAASLPNFYIHSEA